MLVVHILNHGLPLCRFSTELPGDWPADHKWTGLDEPEVSTCAKCRQKAGIDVTTKHWLERIDGIYAVVADDEAGEGVVSAFLGGMLMPLIAADETRLKNIMPFAREIAKTTGKKLRLVKFTTREEIEEITR